MKLGRNEPCHCGSGKKYKKCCEERDAAAKSAELAAQAAQRQAEMEEEENAELAREGSRAPLVAERDVAGSGRAKPVAAPAPAPIRRRSV
jgi:uncharacterized protein YecA (UPF0149 family)